MTDHEKLLQTMERMQETLYHRELMMVRCALGHIDAINWVKEWIADDTREGGLMIYNEIKDIFG